MTRRATRKVMKKVRAEAQLRECLGTSKVVTNYPCKTSHCRIKMFV